MGISMFFSTTQLVILSVLFFSNSLAQECSAKTTHDVLCGLPEVVDAASTGTINFKPVHLVQGYEACKGDSAGKYRTADGTCNNVFNHGSANRPPRRLLPNAYDDGVNSPRTRDTRGAALPAATNVSRTVHPMKDVNKRFTIMLMQWGQFIDHDLTGFPISSEVDRSIKCCGPNGEALNFRPDRECFPILLTPEDAGVRFVGNCMEFARSVAARDPAGKKIIPREQVNSVTSFMDASMVYGSSEELQRELREETVGGQPGFLMKVSPSDLLPRNPEEDICIHRPGEFCFLAGDTRVNEQPGLATIHTVFVRLHNRIARELDLLRPNDTDEEIFQLTRKILIAIIQNIHYNEWLPIIIGRRTMREFGIQTGSRSQYVASVDPRITNAFSTAAFRFGHSLIPRQFVIGGRNRPLRELFNRPDELFNNFNDVLQSLVSPLRTQGAQTFDRFFTGEVTGHLFEPENNGKPSRGLDLVALNIQRGRDHGLPPYNKFRQFCGLPKLTRFDQLPADVALVFEQVYNSPDDIDLFSGIMSEPREPGQLVGGTLACLLGNQFHALKYGDRFYFETDRMPEGFTDDQLADIRRMTLAHVCCQVKAVLKVQSRAFEIPNNSNGFELCSDLRDAFIDLTLFQNF
ncbi:chorion peroxidase-like [Littorina saxatilis]|uniref:Peroxinectin n=1 Tax=Littorina saxatilis TaxID=31220 RepID=A0AAN9BB99_9CAEN